MIYISLVPDPQPIVQLPRYNESREESIVEQCLQDVADEIERIIKRNINDFSEIDPRNFMRYIDEYKGLCSAERELIKEIVSDIYSTTAAEHFIPMERGELTEIRAMNIASSWKV